MENIRLGILSSHPIQYQAPLFRALAQQIDVQVFFAHRQTPEEQAFAGFDVPFSWDVDLLSGYNHIFLENIAKDPSVSHFFGCDTPEIRKYLKEEKFDAFLITGWHLKSYWQAVRSCQEFHIPIMVRGDSQLPMVRSVFKRAVKYAVYKFLLRNFDWFLAVGSRSREYFMHYGIPPGRIYQAPHCVDNEWFSQRSAMTSEQRNHFRTDALNLTPNTLALLFVGKFIPKKRPADLVYAIALLNKKGIRAEAFFVGMGKLRDLIQKTADVTKVKIHFIGFKNQSELPKIYAACDLLVLPSNGLETWGLVVNEAFACGLPAIVSKDSGCGPDLIDEGRTGFTYKTGDCAALAERIEEMIPLFNTPQIKQALKSKIDQYSTVNTAANIHQVLRQIRNKSERIS